MTIADSDSNKRTGWAALEDEYLLRLHAVSVATTFDGQLTAPLSDRSDKGIAMDEARAIDF